ncbi:MAG: hypothetical protein DRP58_04205 [Spirochaetes bacterium]|nr:MAG: hypothetical protein DRP58_04205 [Spirochaetota bacterium]
MVNFGLITWDYTLAKELLEILNKINDEKQTEWLPPFETISTDKSRMDADRKPAAYLSITKTKIEDAFNITFPGD